MRKFSVFVLLLVICFCSCKKKPEELLAAIKKECAAINQKQKELTTRTVDDITSRAPGTLSGYYKDEDLTKIIAQHYTDTCRTFTEYYFDDGMLIFILNQKFVYNKPASYTEEKARAANDSVWYDDKLTELEVNRYYFNENKLIKWVDADNTNVSEKTALFIDKQYGLWAETIVLVKQLKESGPTP